jgi:molybdate transport system permease protein
LDAGELAVRAIGVLFIGFLGLPVAAVVARTIVGGPALDSNVVRGVLDALGLSLLTTAGALVITVVLGTPIALRLARPPNGRRSKGLVLVETLIDLPIVLPPSVAGLALLLVFGRRGLFGPPLETAGMTIAFTTVAVILAQTFVAAPFFVRAARAGFAAVDRDLEDAARVDGADERRVFRHVTLSLAAPSVAAGLVMTWARALGEFGATIMFAGNVEGRTQTLPLLVYAEFQTGDLDTSLAAAAILVVAAFGVIVAVRLLRWPRALDLRAI